MRHQDQHICDEELLSFTDGELGNRAKHVRSHLEACVLCCRRAAEMKKVLMDAARAENSSFELPAIAIPRARLRSRLAELSAHEPDNFERLRFFHQFAALAIGMTTVGVVLVAAVALAVQKYGRPEEVLSFFSHGDVLPNRTYTPGVARQVSLEQVCALPHEEVIKEVSSAERERVFAEYGISNVQADRYEVDYLITPGLGGDDDIRNLWPEPYRSPKWDARVKDVLEERLHQMVCSHQIDLSEAQRAIATNWIAAYEKYVHAKPAQPRSG